MKPFVTICGAVFLLGACSHTVQTTSGKDYLDRYPGALAETGPQPIYATTTAGEIVEAAFVPTDADLIREAASVEPLLQFPARIGLAKLQNGNLVSITEEEADHWARFAARHRALGDFVPVNPVLMEFTNAALARRYGEKHRPKDVATRLRIGAARQHLDAVLIYEVALNSRERGTPFSVTEITVLGGAILPTRDLEASGVANALLLDVRNGYPYGSASARTDLSDLSTTWASDARKAELRDEARVAVVGDLIPELEAMFGALRASMAENRGTLDRDPE